MSFRELRKRPGADTHVTIHIQNWHWDYGLAHSLFKGGNNLSEINSLVVLGMTKQAKTVKGGLAATVKFYAVDRGSEIEETSFLSQARIGSIDRVKGGFDGGVMIARDSLSNVISMLCWGRYPFLRLSLLKTSRLNYNVESYWFLHGLADDD